MSEIRTAKPSLSVLSFVLRNKELWPKGFEWNFSYCYSCAIGLAYCLWQQVPTCHPHNVARAVNIEFMDAYELFMSTPEEAIIHDRKRNTVTEIPVTPEMIADRIDKFLAEKEHEIC